MWFFKTKIVFKPKIVPIRWEDEFEMAWIQLRDKLDAKQARHGS
jgi:hypothetical protein